LNNLIAVPARLQHERPFLNIPPIAVGLDGAQIEEAAARAVSVSQLASPGANLRWAISSPQRKISLEEQLYNSRAACKLKTAAVAMHLDREWRTRFFAQLDSLLSYEDWDKADLPISEDSFTTLLRMLLLVRPKRRPGLGASGDGHVIAMWTVENDRLTVECLPADEVRWIALRELEGNRESAAGQTSLPRLLEVLQPYGPQRWFSNEGPKASV
jgi:hypothetical protein